MTLPKSAPVPLWGYLLLSYPFVLFNMGSFVGEVSGGGIATACFVAVVFLTYGLIYLLVAMLPALLTARLLRRVLTGRGRNAGIGSGLIVILAVLGTTLLQVFLFADGRLLQLYGFHINGFVMNLVTTPGGIESLGGGIETTLAFGLVALGFLILQGALMLAMLKGDWLNRSLARLLPRKAVWLTLVPLALSASMGERVAYGISKASGDSAILSAAAVFPFYKRTSFSKLAKRYGIDSRQPGDLRMRADAQAVKYPLRPLARVPHRELNIVWLVAESWRADALNPEIMPATWSFAGRATRFTQHYSGGNGTRMGIFSMFYGLYGSYWFAFLNERRGPVLVDAMLDDGYQVQAYTSARFSYPEFDKTVWARLRAETLHERTQDAGWKDDRANVGKMLGFIEHRDRQRPFMAFMFFESPHARYFFPPESAIRKPYLEDFNYATMDERRDMPLIYNRYLNSCHHLDSQFARVFEYLETHQLLDSTIVIVTGDHGEEFMENGRWGHNSAFSEQQVRVPLVLWVPGRKPAVMDHMTSHLDLPATILPLLGVTNPPEHYSQGFDLFGPARREYAIVSDWSTMAYVDQRYKVVFPLKAAGYAHTQRVSFKNDQPVRDASAVYVSRQERFVRLLRDLGRFAG